MRNLAYCDADAEKNYRQKYKVKAAFDGVQVPFWRVAGTVARLAQLGEHLIYDQKVFGSNPKLGFGPKQINDMEENFNE